MPTDACPYICECTPGSHRMRPSKGKCCGYCSYERVPCPPMPHEHGSCIGPSCCRGLAHGATFIHVRHRSRPASVTGFKLAQCKPRGTHEVVDLSVQMTAARATAPQRREPILPFAYAGVRRKPVL